MPLALHRYVRRFLGPRRDDGYLHQLYAEMHEVGAFKGLSWKTHLENFKRVVPEQGRRRILDFGCGPKGGLALEFGDSVISYDPHVDAFSAPPWDQQFDAVFSSDVLEHMSERQLGEFFERVRQSSANYVFLNVSTRKAFKTLPDGTNAHLTVKPAAWWLTYAGTNLGSEFEAMSATEDLLRAEVTLCLRRKDHRDGHAA